MVEESGYWDVEYVSDIYYGYSAERDSWDVPVVEWDGFYGKRRVRYESEEARDAALKANSLVVDRHLRAMAAEKRAKARKRRLDKAYLNSLRTLGANFPVLGKLKHSMMAVYA
jgi:hypothetical protein